MWLVNKEIPLFPLLFLKLQDTDGSSQKNNVSYVKSATFKIKF